MASYQAPPQRGAPPTAYPPTAYAPQGQVPHQAQYGGAPPPMVYAQQPAQAAPEKPNKKHGLCYRLCCMDQPTDSDCCNCCIRCWCRGWECDGCAC